MMITLKLARPRTVTNGANAYWIARMTAIVKLLALLHTKLVTLNVHVRKIVLLDAHAKATIVIYQIRKQSW